MGKRILVTGLGTFWGGRIAQALEQDERVEMIVGLDSLEPSVELDRTEFVKADQSYSILARIVKATQVDTIVHTFLVVDSTHMSGRKLHEINVIGTMNLLAAASAPGSSIRHVVVKSSSLVYGANYTDPTWFTEDSVRTREPRTRVERSLLEVEGYLRDYAVDNPQVSVSVLRYSNVLGTDIVTPITTALSLPGGITPSVLGFDPLLQFVEEVDVIRAMEYAIERELSGVFNVAGKGRIPWSEVASACGRRLIPLPPVLTGLAAMPLGRLRLVDLPTELLDLLRYGRGIDGRRLVDDGFRYRFSSSGAVDAFAKAQRLRSIVGSGESGYRYERDVENFFRHSPAVVRDR